MRKQSVEGFIAPAHPSLLSAEASLSGVDFEPLLGSITTASAKGQVERKDDNDLDPFHSWQTVRSLSAVHFEDWNFLGDLRGPCASVPPNNHLVTGGDAQESTNWNVDFSWYHEPQTASQSQPQQTQHSGFMVGGSSYLGGIDQTFDRTADLAPDEAALLGDEDFRLFYLGTS